MSDIDRTLFLGFIDKYLNRFHFKTHAYCLLDKQVHLLLESSEANLSSFMGCLLTSYTTSFHIRNKTWGHLFKDRFKSYIVEKGVYLLNVSRIIHLLPFKKGICKKPESYKWSSFQAYLDNKNTPSFVYKNEILSWFDGNSQDYKNFVSEGMKNPNVPEIFESQFIGSLSFANRIKSKLKKNNIECSLKRKNERIRKQGYEYAQNLLQEVCQKYKCKPDDLKNGRRRHGIMHDILIMMICLIRKNTQWTFHQIADYFHISTTYTQILYHNAHCDPNDPKKKGPEESGTL